MSHSFRAAPGWVDWQEYYPWNKMSVHKFSSFLPAGLEAAQRAFHVSYGFAADKQQLISQLFHLLSSYPNRMVIQGKSSQHQYHFPTRPSN